MQVKILVKYQLPVLSDQHLKKKKIIIMLLFDRQVNKPIDFY